jgi:hypothetical protein
MVETIPRRCMVLDGYLGSANGVRTVSVQLQVTKAVLFVVGATLSRLLLAAPLDEPMTFSLRQPCEGSACGYYILAQGAITPNTPWTFSAFLEKIDFKPTIYFHSGGGDIKAAIEMGYMVRKAGLDAFVGGPYEEMVKTNKPYKTLVKNGMCFSACAYVFLGGVTREIGDGNRYGVHQFYGGKGALGEGPAQVTITILANYLDEMGVDRKLLDIASLTSPSGLQVIPVNLARALNVDNTDPPKSEWAIKADINGELFIATAQSHAWHDAVTRFIITRERSVIKGTLFNSIRQKFRSVMEMDEVFRESTKLTFKMDGEVFGPTLQVPSGWSRVKNDGYSVSTYTVSFQLPITSTLSLRRWV